MEFRCVNLHLWLHFRPQWNTALWRSSSSTPQSFMILDVPFIVSQSAASITDVPADAGFLCKQPTMLRDTKKRDKLQNSYMLKLLPHCMHIQITYKPVCTKIIRSAYLKTYAPGPILHEYGSHSLIRSRKNCNKKQHNFYRCTVHYGIYILFTHQQMHFYYTLKS